MILENNMLLSKLDEYSKELKYLKNRNQFSLSKSLRQEFESDSCKNDWSKLAFTIKKRDLSPKDMVVLKLYFTFIGIELNDETNSFYDELISILDNYGNDCQLYLDPDSSFEFNSVNVEKIKELLIGLNQDKFMNSEVSQLCIFDIFTNIIIEALQFLNFIPYTIESEIEEIEQTLNVSEQMKEYYIKLNDIPK